jgi:hypothetical protein
VSYAITSKSTNRKSSFHWVGVVLTNYLILYIDFSSMEHKSIVRELPKLIISGVTFSAAAKKSPSFSRSSSSTTMMTFLLMSSIASSIVLAVFYL